ncbi:MAG: endolytic transglycosylase MltG, partial [Tannerella sp.]|nr:endolytic transglycosylase MltG [Tannerella sp.]
MKRTTKKLLYTGSIVIILAAVVACGSGAYRMLYMPNFTPAVTKYVYICEDDKNFGRLCKELRDSAGCKNIKLFELLAELRKYPANMKSGLYAVEPGMNNQTLLNRLRYGQQSPVRLTFNSVRMINDLIGKLSAQLMPDNDDFLVYLGNEDYCRSLGFDTATIKAMFIPNTYEVYWNTTADKLIKRMKREYDTFWTTDRLKKAENIRLSPLQISILASIVEEETAIPEEYQIVAGLYINRLIKGIPLQADPTVKYAVGDFSLKRILNKHLEVDSPYNTYLYEGLPPAPIRIPSVKSIDAVLNYMHHNYLYMCAK